MAYIRLLHALPNSFLPDFGKTLLIEGIDPEKIREMMAWIHWRTGKTRPVISHVRYVNLCSQISTDLGVEISSNGENSPTPWDCDDVFIVCSLSPGETEVKYLLVWDATKELREAGL